MKRPLVGGLVLCTVSFVHFSAQRAHAAIENRTILKTFYETGDKPTEAQFGAFIDSMSVLTGGLDVVGIGIVTSPVAPQPGDTVSARRFGIGIEEPVYPLGYLSPTEFNLVVETEFAGEFGFMALALSDGTGQIFYGFLQLTMDAPGAATPLGIHVEYLAFETTAGALLTTFVVPAPSGVVVLGVAGFGLVRRRR